MQGLVEMCEKNNTVNYFATYNEQLKDLRNCYCTYGISYGITTSHKSNKVEQAHYSSGLAVAKYIVLQNRIVIALLLTFVTS